jgi:hypothetical protein
MKKLILIAGIAALAACGQQEAAPADEANVAVANATAPAATPAAFQLNETTWTFTDKDGQAIQESIDASGNYVANSGAKHVDHGTAVMKGDKACFTSAMNKEGEECWTTQPVAIGQSFETTSDKGEKLTVMRVDYVPATM